MKTQITLRNFYDKKKIKHKCLCKKTKNKSHEFYGNDNNDNVKMKVRDETSFPYLVIWLIKREPINTGGPVPQESFIHQCQQHIEPMS